MPTALPRCSLALLLTAGACLPAMAADTDFFEKKIRPVLVKNCYKCHSAEGEMESGLRVDTRDGLRQGGDRGPAVVPNDVRRSLIIAALGYGEEDLQMPPDGKLPDGVLADFRKWIAMGAPDPRDE